MAASGLPQINTSELEKRHQTSLSNFTMRAEKLSKRPLDKLTAELASELDTDAKHWLEAWDGETKGIKDALFKAHRIFTAFCAKMSGPAENARTIARRIIGRYQLQEAEKREAERREAEKLAREAEERRKQLEVTARLEEAADAEKNGNHDLAEFITQEALDAESQPVIPIAIPEAPAVKVEGTSTSFKLVGTVNNPIKYLCFLMGIEYTSAISERSDKGALVNEAIASWSQSGINAQLKRGLPLQEHGVKVERVPITRNLNR